MTTVFEAEVEVEVICLRCGRDLQTTVEYRRGGPVILVEPCDNCIEDAKNEGYDKGYDEGQL